jgi:hypothetical protein
MTEYEINTFKIDFDAISEIEEVDVWLDKLSRVLNGYVERRDGTEVKQILTARAEARVWMFVDLLLDKRLEFTTEEAIEQDDRLIRVCN